MSKFPFNSIGEKHVSLPFYSAALTDTNPLYLSAQVNNCIPTVHIAKPELIITGIQVNHHAFDRHVLSGDWLYSIQSSGDSCTEMEFEGSIKIEPNVSQSIQLPLNTTLEFEVTDNGILRWLWDINDQTTFTEKPFLYSDSIKSELVTQENCIHQFQLERSMST